MLQFQHLNSDKHLKLTRVHFKMMLNGKERGCILFPVKINLKKKKKTAQCLQEAVGRQTHEGDITSLF